MSVARRKRACPAGDEKIRKLRTDSLESVAVVNP
jgi:hypothetical protein